MHRLAFLLPVAACVDHGESPTSCAPDFELLGDPGAMERLSLSLTAGELSELCLLLDARSNRDQVTFQAEHPGDGHLLQLALRGVEGTELAVDDGRDLISFTFPAGSRQFCILEIQLAEGFLSGGGTLSLSFAEFP